MSPNTHITVALTPETPLEQAMKATEGNEPASVTKLTNEKFEPLVKNLEIHPNTFMSLALKIQTMINQCPKIV